MSLEINGYDIITPGLSVGDLDSLVRVLPSEAPSRRNLRP